MTVVCRWAADQAEARAACEILGRLMLLDPAYISHSEIQWGLAPDGDRWAEDAQDQLSGYFAWIRSNPDAQIAVALARDGAIAAVALVTWESDKPGHVAILQDMAVDPKRRSEGVGAALLAFLETEAQARGRRWLMLESGVRNHRAHAFFERSGLAVVSHTFAKRLGEDA